MITLLKQLLQQKKKNSKGMSFTYKKPCIKERLRFSCALTQHKRITLHSLRL